MCVLVLGHILAMIVISAAEKVNSAEENMKKSSSKGEICYE